MTMRALVRRWLRWPLARRSSLERLQREYDKLAELCRHVERRATIASVNAALFRGEAVRQHERARKVGRN